jgi:hypothetical protein
MGFVNTEQTTAIIDSVAKVVEASQPVAEAVPKEPWWQIFAIVGGTIATLLTAWAGYVAVKKRKKP